MDSQYHVIVTTVLLLIGTTLFYLFYWLFVQRPTLEKLSRGERYPEWGMGIRRGGNGWSSASVAFTAAFVAIVCTVFSLAVYYDGYMWWFAIAANAGLWMSVMFLADLKLTPPQFRRAMLIFGLGIIPSVIAYGAAWADFIHLVDFPRVWFHILNGLSLAAYLYATFKPEDKIARHRHRHHKHR